MSTNYFKSSEPKFSDEEINKLSPYVTNIHSPVFVLKNLPEVIKGALFSRYSRSKLGLRSLLLKEFMSGNESGFGEIAPSEGAMPSNSAGAIQKAQNFYDRILDGYGDDSIGELGGAHLAIEDVSMIATKVIEDARIGGSPLEKSTRYIYFDETVDGEFRYFREPVLMNSKFKHLYLETCDMLFKTYQSMIEPLGKFVEDVFPQEDGVSDAAYRSSHRARVCDALRGLLPASTKTNMGIFGNGRFFEALIQKLHVSGLQELNMIGDEACLELSKVIPSFVRRAQRNHKHFSAFQDYMTRLNKIVTRKQAWNAASPQLVSKIDEVRLVSYDDTCIYKVLSALYFEHSGLCLNALEESVRGFSHEKLSQIISEISEIRQNRRHKPPRAFEHADFTFELTGDFGMYRDLHRHRILTQERQPLSTILGYDTPPDIIDAGLKGDWDRAMETAQKAFIEISKDFPLQAQYIVPMGYRIRWYMKINLRSLLWLVELRSQPQGHINYRRMAQKMASKVIEKIPEFKSLFKFVDWNDYQLGRLDQEIRKENKKLI